MPITPDVLKLLLQGLTYLSGLLAVSINWLPYEVWNVFGGL